MIEQIGILILLLFLSGFFSGSETALFSLSDIKLHNMLNNGRKGAKLVHKLKSDPHKLLTVLLISNNLVNIGASALATVMAIEIFGSIGPGIATGVMTFLVLVFGEITPKTIAVTHNESMSIFVSKPIYFVSILLFPLVFIFEKFSKQVTRMSGAKEDTKIVSEDDLRTMASVGAKEGTIGQEEKTMIHGVLKLEDEEIYRVMTPRTEVFSLDMQKKVGEVVEEVLEQGYSRIPVYDKRISNVKGIIYVKDILKALHKNQKISLKRIMKKPIIVPELKKIDDLLSEFKKKKVHFAVVVDEHGDITGIVTMEDLLEEIVGEIYDETDKEEFILKKLNDKAFIVSGRADMDEVSQAAKLNLKGIDTDEFETVNGLIQHTTGRIPQKGEKINFKQFIIEVLEIDSRRVLKAKIVKKE